MWLPAGLSVNDLERIIDEIGAACWAREARITPVQGQAALVWVDIIRRDPLGAQRPLSPPVVDHLDSQWPPGVAADSATVGDPTPAAPSRPRRRHAAARQSRQHGHRAATTARRQRHHASNGTARNGAGKNAPGTDPGAQADPPGVTGFGGVDVTDYV